MRAPEGDPGLGVAALVGGADRRAAAAADDNGGGWLRKILRDVDEAEKDLAAAQKRLWQAEEAARNARDDFPEAAMAHYDISAPSARSRFLRYRQTESEQLEAGQAVQAAEARLRRALTRSEALDQLGLGAGPAPGSPDDPDDGSLAWGERTAERARRRRIR